MTDYDNGTGIEGAVVADDYGNSATTDATGYYELWLDPSSGFPVRIVSHARDGAIIETVTMDDLDIDVPLPDAVFDPGEER